MHWNCIEGGAGSLSGLSMSLRDLPKLLRDDPALLEVRGRTNALIAVPEPARAFTIAGLVATTNRRPYLVAVPTTADGERLTHDLAAFLGPDRVDLFPAWGPAVRAGEPRGRDDGPPAPHDLAPARTGRVPDVVIAPIRALVQRLGPDVEKVEPVEIEIGQRRDRDELVSSLVGAGYRREDQVEHRGEVAVRGSIVDIFPSTADTPVRVDLWGDEIDRLSEFSVNDQRSTNPLERVLVFPCRELLPTEEVRERADLLIAREPWGREQWERLANGLAFDGMESWLPWLVDREHVLLDLLPADAQIILVEPKRLRDRAADILAEEADLARTLAKTWGADVEGTSEFPSLHMPFDRLLAHTDAPAWTMTTAPEGPSVTTIQAMGWDPVVGGGDRLLNQLANLRQQGYRIVVGADGEGSANRIRRLLDEHGLKLEVEIEALERGFILPAIKLAVLAEGDLTGRRRAHRAARTRRRTDAAKFFDDLSPGDYVVHHQHGVAKFGGMVKRAISGVERDYLLLEYRGDDKLYVPSDQIDTVRHYTGGDQPTLSKLGGSDWAKTKARVKSEVTEIAQELVVLYQTRVHSPGHAFPPDTPWQRELEEGFPYQETVDQLQAITDVKADMEQPTPMDRLVCGDVGFGKTEVAIRAAFKAVQDGKQVAVLVPTTLLAQQHGQTFGERFSGYPVRVEVLSRFLTPKQARRWCSDSPTAASMSSSVRTGCSRKTSSSKSSGCSSSTKSSASA